MGRKLLGEGGQVGEGRRVLRDAGLEAGPADLYDHAPPVAEHRSVDLGNRGGRERLLGERGEELARCSTQRAGHRSQDLTIRH